MSSFSSRLKEAMQIRNVRAVDLVNATGIAKSRISQYVNGIYEAKQTALYQLAQALDVSEAWLMGYDVPMERVPVEKANAVFLPEQKIHMVPLYESASAGFGALANGNVIDYVPLYFIHEVEAEETICIKVQGDSMFPKIEDGDIIQVHRQESVDSGSLAVVLMDGEEGLVKRVVYGDGWIELQSINPMYPPMRFEKNNVLRVRVVGAVRTIIKKV